MNANVIQFNSIQQKQCMRYLWLMLTVKGDIIISVLRQRITKYAYIQLMEHTIYRLNFIYETNIYTCTSEKNDIPDCVWD